MPHSRDRRDDPREIAKWAERYARSRTIPFLVQWGFIVALVIVLGGLSQGAVTAYRYGRTTLQWVFIISIAVMTLLLLWFSIAKWGRDQIWRISQWVYRREGYAAYSGGEAAERARRARWMPLVGVGLSVYHLIGAVLVGLHYLPMKYLQPFSALYMVPFLGIMIVTQRLGFWAWIWPLLYGLHAILLMTDAPIHFRGKWEFLDIIVPMFGYGLISMIAGHIYSRYAFRRLKQLARAGLDDIPQPSESEQE